ncbi:hypothetical protein VIGAN_06197200 [Vigna angularis var. angularis]|uniref:Uncharacterized protein n=1 Tax=Vigna angularis var. angularis TaxID=157739 RepID=A0A0S3SCV1_PHAAN|nr:hypothetical protein VIGAN_06197200 [Vigna angularis var. angularis]
MARFLQARMGTELAFPRWIRSHRNRNHKVLPRPYRNSLSRVLCRGRRKEFEVRSGAQKVTLSARRFDLCFGSLVFGTDVFLPFQSVEYLSG